MQEGEWENDGDHVGDLLSHLPALASQEGSYLWAYGNPSVKDSRLA